MGQLTPHDTGKVKIGKYYQRPLSIEQTDEELFIQGLLLQDRYKERWGFRFIGYVLLAMFFIFMFSAITR